MPRPQLDELVGLTDILRDQADQEVVEGFDLEVADGSFDVVAADAAVVREEDVGAAGEDGEVAAHEFALLGGGRAEDGDDLDAVLRIALDGALEAFDDALVVLMGGSVQDEESDAGAGRCVPVEVLQAGLQGGVDGFGMVAAAAGVLHRDILDGLAVVVRKLGVLGHVIVAFVSIEDSAGAEFDVTLPALYAVQDVHEVLLEEGDFVAHRPGRVHDEGDIGLFRGLLGAGNLVEVDIGLFLLDIPGGHFRGAGLLDAVDDEGDVLRAGLRMERVDPKGGLAEVVGAGAPDGLLALLQAHRDVGQPLSGGVRHADRHPARGVEAPVIRHAIESVRGHQVAPEVPVVQVVPFAGRQDAGAAAGITELSAPCGFGLGVGVVNERKTSAKIGF